MKKTLEETHTWEELAELTANRIAEHKLLTKFNKKEFIQWFMERKNIGYTIDWKLIARAYNTWKKLNNEADSFTVIVGDEGSGKTTISFQFGSWVSPKMSLENDVCYSMKQVIKRMREIADSHKIGEQKEAQTLLLDEGVLDLFSRDAMKKSNRILAKMFMVQRFLNVHIMICIPKFQYIDSIIRDHRVQTLLSIKQRGKYKCICGSKAIGLINLGLKKNKHINAISIPYGYFFEGDFSKRFPYNIDKKEYEKLKLKNIKDFLAETEQDNQPAMLKVGTAAEKLGMTGETLKNHIKAGNIKGRKIFSEWFITKESYDKLICT